MHLKPVQQEPLVPIASMTVLILPLDCFVVTSVIVTEQYVMLRLVVGFMVKLLYSFIPFITSL